jgi:DNA-binding NarL/FixJ family response regulator
VIGVLPETSPCRTLPLTDTEAVFVGRASLCGLLDAQVASVAGGGSASVISGEPGIGKTALLRRLALQAPARVLWVRGSQGETALPYAGLADLLRPLLRHLDRLPDTQRRALEVVLALADGPVGTALAVCSGTLGLLGAAGDEEPLVVLVDDLPWIDAESRQALLFVGRRLSLERVVMIFSARDGPGSTAWAQDLPVVRLSGLNLEECEELVRRRRLPVTDGRLHHLVQRLRGNPLALIETLARTGETSEARAPAAGIALGDSLTLAWRSALERLSEHTRRSLFVLAVANGPGLPGLEHVLGSLGLGLDDLIEAEHQGFVQVDQGRLDISHPLLRQVLIDSTPIGFRTLTARALADLVSDDLRAWYLSWATVGADEDLAQALLRGAAAARRRGGHSAAARTVKRAADLSPKPADRARRTLEAASDALMAGEGALADDWATQALGLETDPAFTCAATLVKGAALTWLGRLAAAFTVLQSTAAAIEPADAVRAAELLSAAVLPAEMTGDAERAYACARRSARLRRAAGVPASLTAQATGFHSALVVADRPDDTDLDRMIACAEAADPVAEQQAIAVMAHGLGWLERDDVAGALVDRTIEGMRRSGAPQTLPFALAVRAELETSTGRWSAAYADAFEAVQWAEENHQQATLGFALLNVARIDAARGRRDVVQDLVHRTRREARPTGAGVLEFYEGFVLGLDAVSAGDHASAIEILEPVWAKATSLGLAHPNAIPFVADLAEAHLRCGDRERGLALVEWLERQAEHLGLLAPVALARRCRGLATEDADDAVDVFRAAQAAHHACLRPFEQARTLLCLGEALRRDRRAVDSRGALREAYQLFSDLGAVPWAEAAARELAASGVRPVATAPNDALGRLTPQEVQVARMVASGCSNAETAGALFLSAKTVEAHLTRIFRKLQVRSRSELTAIVVRRDLGT